MFRVSISTGILGARVCGLCRTYCDYNRWLRFSPYRVLRLHMHLSLGTSRQAHTVLTPRHTGIGVLGASASTYAAPFATATGGLNSLPVEPTVYSCTCGDIYCAGTSIARCTLPLVGTCAGTISVLAPAPVMVYIALASAVSYAAPVQVLEYFAPAPVTYYALLRLQQVVSILSLSCPPSTLSRVVEYIAPAPAVSCAAQTQVLVHFAPAFSASAGPFATATGSSILSLSCPPSTLALVVEYIALAPAVYAAPAPVMVYLALAQAVSHAAQAQVLEYFAPAFSASAGPFCDCNREFHSLPVVPTVYICTCGGVLCAGTTMVCCTAPVLMYIALTGTREPSF